MKTSSSSSTEPKLIHVMVDLETLGLEPGSTILQLGAVAFTATEMLETYTAFISRDSCEEAGLVEDNATLEWWNSQDSSIKSSVFSGDVPLKAALQGFTAWFKGLNAEYKLIWSNGADFDLPLLKVAYSKLKLPTPWNYRNVRCYRTVTSLFPLTKNAKDVLCNPTPHDALSDAIYQAELLQLTAELNPALELLA